jgi:hypothetical protein
MLIPVSSKWVPGLSKSMVTPEIGCSKAVASATLTT